MLRLYIPGLDRLLSQIDFTVAFGGDKILPMPGGYLLPALAVGMLTRIFHLHARISDWLGIRECFDVEVIIAELAAQLAIDLSLDRRRAIDRSSRHNIMRRAFYPFVSGPQPQIDPQLIQQALDAWSWFWIGIEATLVFTLTGLGLIAGGAYERRPPHDRRHAPLRRDRPPRHARPMPPLRHRPSPSHPRRPRPRRRRPQRLRRTNQQPVRRPTSGLEPIGSAMHTLHSTLRFPSQPRSDDIT